MSQDKWWTNVVRVWGPTGIAGSGTFVAPNLVLTAAHVMADAGQGWSASLCSRVYIRQFHPPQGTLQALEVRLCAQWLEGAPSQDEFDMCLIRVQGNLGPQAGIEVSRDFGEVGSEYALNVYGYPWTKAAATAQHDYVRALMTRNIASFTSGINVRHGVSGGPILTAVSESRLLAGMITRGPERAGDQVVVGLPLRDDNFGVLMSALS